MNSFPSRRPDPVPRTLLELAALLEVPPPELKTNVALRGVAPLALASADQLGFLGDGRYLADLEESRAAALLISRELAGRVTDSRPQLVVEDPYQALAALLEEFHPEGSREPEIHPSAVVGPGVRLGRDVWIGPYAVLEEAATVGDGTTVGAHTVVGARCRIGTFSVLHPHSVLYPGTRLGDRVVVHAGACVGVDGFGYVYRDGAHHKVPQVGACIIDDDVEIGANTTVDRGSIGPTRVEAGVKVDNLVQLGHNVVIGSASLLAAQVGIAGSTRIGAGVLIGGQAGVGGHLSVGESARLAGQSGVVGDVPTGVEVMGFPARPRAEFLRGVAAQARFPELVKRVRRLEQLLERLDAEEVDGEDDPRSSP